MNVGYVCLVLLWKREMEVIRSQIENSEVREMLTNIIVAIMSVIAIAAGIWVWWLENGGSSEDSKKDDDIKDNDIEETEGKSKDEKN
mgnify:FL=1